MQFQLTVNCAALIICFIGAVVGGQEPLNVLQLLWVNLIMDCSHFHTWSLTHSHLVIHTLSHHRWVNLIMDTMGALALATELPHPALLEQPPNGHSSPLINTSMWKHIIIQGVYQVCGCVCVGGGDELCGGGGAEGKMPDQCRLVWGRSIAFPWVQKWLIMANMELLCNPL